VVRCNVRMNVENAQIGAGWHKKRWGGGGGGGAKVSICRKHGNGSTDKDKTRAISVKSCGRGLMKRANEHVVTSRANERNKRRALKAIRGGGGGGKSDTPK